MKKTGWKSGRLIDYLREGPLVTQRSAGESKKHKEVKLLRITVTLLPDSP